jgi:hypothetical protein
MIKNFYNPINVSKNGQFVEFNVFLEKINWNGPLSILARFCKIIAKLLMLSAWTKLFSMNFDKVKELCQSQKHHKMIINS